MTTHVFDSTGVKGGDTELLKAVGQRYNCGLSDGTHFYGYMFEPTTGKDGGFHWKTDTTTKEALTQFSSQQLIDRDLAFFPRVTDGDFSGGAFQEVFIDPRKFFDADLDPRIPGYLQLRPQWTRIDKGALGSVGPQFQVVAWNGDFWFTFGEPSGNVYSANGGTTTVPTATNIISLDTDGTYLYAGTGAQLYRSANGTSWTAVTSSINGTATQWWVINQGTNGYFAYYQSGSNLLYKIDLTQAFPIAAAAEPQIPVGANAINIVDLCAYQTSIAILTTDVAGPGSDVWYFDGNNLTRIIRIEGYVAQGVCNALGALYVGGFAVGQTTSPKLFQVDAGNYNEVVVPGSPFPAAAQSCLQPRASGRYVYWPILSPSIKGISNGVGVIIQYDVVTAAASKLPCQGADDFSVKRGSLRSIALYGDNVAAIFQSSAHGILQYQQTLFGSIKYQATGWLASSHIDFGTPGIVKRFRRLEVHHAPLNAGEAIFIECFVDQDPLGFSTVLAPVPASQNGGNNNQAGTTITSLMVGSDTVGKTLYFAVRMTAGTGQLTTPRISYITVEVGGTWVADVYLGCVNRRTMLNQQPDDQGASGGDLAYLLFLAYENGNVLTFYHPNGQKYTMAIESLDPWNPNPTAQMQSQENRPRTEEYIVHAVLRQAA